MPTSESASPFVSIPLRPRFFQASAFFPMPIVLLATRGSDGAANLAPYSLCFPRLTQDGHGLVLVTRSASKTAQNLIRTGRVAINFIPDKPEFLANCKVLAAAVPTAEKMPQSIFKLVNSECANGLDGTLAPPLVTEAIQVFECRLIAAEPVDGAAAAVDGVAEHRFSLEVEAIRMLPYWAGVLESGRRGPRLPVDYGFRRATDRWMHGPGVTASGPRLRPRFEVQVDRPPELVLADFRAALARPDGPVVGKIRGDVLQIGLPAAELTTWSPSLDLSVSASAQGSVIHGRIGPQPQVWTTFMFFHALIALCGLGGLVWGLSQGVAGGSPWALWITAVAVFLHAFVAGAAFIGQGLGADQTHRLRSFVDDVLTP